MSQHYVMDSYVKCWLCGMQHYFTDLIKLGKPHNIFFNHVRSCWAVILSNQSRNVIALNLSIEAFLLYSPADIRGVQWRITGSAVFVQAVLAKVSSFEVQAPFVDSKIISWAV